MRVLSSAEFPAWWDSAEEACPYPFCAGAAWKSTKRWEHLPAWSLGYISVTATLGIACTSIFFAPLGARLAHALPVGTLRKVFAVFLYITAARMLWSIIA